MKKYFLIFSIVLAIGLISLSVYYFSTNNTKISSVLDRLIPNLNNEPTPVATSTLQVKIISQKPISNYWISGESIYFLNTDGQISKITNQQTETVNSQTLNRINQSWPAPDNQGLLVLFNYPDNPSFGAFNLTANTWRFLPTNTIAAAWSPDSKKIAFVEDRPTAGSLKIIDLNTNKIQEIVKISQKDIALEWKRDSEIWLRTQTPSFDELSSLWKINISNKTLTPLAKEESGLLTNVSLSANLGLKFQNLNRQPKLNLIDGDFNNLLDLSFLTLPEKCLIDGIKIFCAVPKNIPNGITLPDDYYKRKIYFQDNIYLFNFETGAVMLLLENQNQWIDATNLKPQDKKLFFLNRYDNQLYQLDL